MLWCRVTASAASQLLLASSSAKQAAVQYAVITYKCFQYEVSFEYRGASRFFTVQSKTLLFQQSAAVRVSLCSAAVCVRNT
jgi:hypothetical protein